MSSYTNDEIKSADWLSLSDDEDIVWWGHPSIIPFLVEIFLGGVIAIGGIVTPFILGIEIKTWVLALMIGTFLFGSAIAIYEYAVYLTTFYIITTNKLKLKEGIYARSTQSIQHDDIENTEVTQKIYERLLGFGDVTVASAGTAQPEIHWYNVTEPNRVRDYINIGSDDGVINIDELNDR